MIYVITCHHIPLTRVVMTESEACEILRDQKSSLCSLVGFSSAGSVDADEREWAVAKALAILDREIMSIRRKPGSNLDELRIDFAIMYNAILDRFSSYELERSLFARGPGEVLALQLEEGEE